MFFIFKFFLKFDEKSIRYRTTRRLWNHAEWITRKTARGTHVTSVGKLYWSNEAIKSSGRHVITAYKSARKILAILATARRIAVGWRWKDDREEGGGQWREEAKCVRVFSRSVHAEIDSRLLFPFLPHPKFDRLNPSARWFRVPSTRRSLASFTRKRQDASLHANSLAVVTYLTQNLFQEEFFPQTYGP